MKLEYNKKVLDYNGIREEYYSVKQSRMNTKKKKQKPEGAYCLIL